MKISKFPQDFKFRSHPIGQCAQFCYPDFENVEISVVIGDVFYSNGVDTYEMYDFRQNEPQGWLTVDDINNHLLNNPF